MPDLPETPNAAALDREFLSQEILPFIAEHLHSPAVLTAPLPKFTLISDQNAWRDLNTIVDGSGSNSEFILAMFINTVNDGATVPPGLYIGPRGWNIYTIVHELVHWADFEVVNKAKQNSLTSHCHEALAFAAQESFYKRFPHYRGAPRAYADIADVAESLRLRVREETEACKMAMAFMEAWEASRSEVKAVYEPNGPYGLQVYEICKQTGRRAVDHDVLSDVTAARFCIGMAFNGKFAFDSYEGEVTYEVEETRSRVILYRVKLSAKKA